VAKSTGIKNRNGFIDKVKFSGRKGLVCAHPKRRGGEKKREERQKKGTKKPSPTTLRWRKVQLNDCTFVCSSSQERKNGEGKR